MNRAAIVYQIQAAAENGEHGKVGILSRKLTMLTADVSTDHGRQMFIENIVNDALAHYNIDHWYKGTVFKNIRGSYFSVENKTLVFGFENMKNTYLHGLSEYETPAAVWAAFGHKVYGDRVPCKLQGGKTSLHALAIHELAHLQKWR